MAVLLPKHLCYMTALLSSTTILLLLYFQKSVLVLTHGSYGFVSERSLCVCHSCVADRGKSNWFNELYQPNVPILLNSTNSVLSASVSMWWNELQSNAGNYTEVVDQLFSLFPDKEHYSDAGPDRCRICAVVGNSRNLLGSNYGPLIDFHDFVMRTSVNGLEWCGFLVMFLSAVWTLILMAPIHCRGLVSKGCNAKLLQTHLHLGWPKGKINKGPTEGYEKDVGSKTTHRILYPESAVDLDNSTHLVLFPLKILDMQWLISAFTTKNITQTYTDVPSTIKANKDKVMILHPEFIRYVYDNWAQRHGTYPSTGFLTLIFALHVCDEVNVFGFGATSDGIWHHYFDESLTSYESGFHGGNFENETINRLQQEYKIVIYKGWT